MPRAVEASFNADLIHLEAPSPDGDSYKSFLMRQKIESDKQFPRQKAPAAIEKKKSSAPQPKVGYGLPITEDRFNGLFIQNYFGGIPNDNTLAVSNDGVVMAAINSAVFAYDADNDSILFPQHIISLAQVAPDINGRFYDPKLIYDEHADRFILVFLKDNVPSTSHIIVCFSSSKDPLDPWHCYEIPGNPLDNNRWTDFPAINITEDELFITGNLIIPNVSWQVGFDGSVIWQIDKEAGYNNLDSLPNRLYHDIRYNGRYTRNLHPVRGTQAFTREQYFLSNRNFDIQNDSIFVLNINGSMDDPNTRLEVTVGQSDLPYGVPPNGLQADTDTSDPTKGLQTNDARVLGAITNGDWIQYVSTTKDFSSGRAAVYHGNIENPLSSEMSITGNILRQPGLDLGYPNLAFTGNEDCDREVIIGVNYTSLTDFPGVGTFYCGNDGSYSDFLRLKEGEDYVNRHSDSYERWGDYFGIQPRFNHPGEVWTAGFWGLEGHRNGTWINQLSSPDSSSLIVQAAEIGESVFCNGELRFLPSGGTPPFKFVLDGVASEGEIGIVSNLCDGDTVSYLVTDARGCTKSGSWVLEQKVSTTASGVYPNPAEHHFVSQFTLKSDQLIDAYLFDLQGRLMHQILRRKAKAGLNELHFDLAPLRNGVYVLKVMHGEEEILTKEVVKSNL